MVENGVPLEHLVSCLSCVELKQGIGSVKYLICTGNKSKTYDNNHEGKIFNFTLEIISSTLLNNNRYIFSFSCFRLRK